MEQITIITPQFERKETLSFETPATQDEFYNIVNNAPFEILKGYGFRKWDTMNNIIKENIKDEGKPGMMSVPTYSLEEAADAIVGAIEGNPKEPSGNMIMDIGCKQPTPKQLLEVDEDIVLLPGEWYDIIPNGFMVTGLFGEAYAFESGKSDDDIRYGCLPYGIRRKVEQSDAVKSE